MTVTELNELIRLTLKSDPRLRMLRLTGEVSSFRNHFASGHWYFSLKDQESAISCCMYRQNNLRSGFLPREGDSVTVTGYVDYYQRDGKIQLYVISIKKAGIGDLYEQFEVLKQKLYTEGLFDQARKKILPQVPGKVAVITSSSGAALHDILNVSGMRSPEIPIVIIPSGVQGTQAVPELISALHQAEKLGNVDVIILARGGGAAEDLWCFNDERLSRAVAACPIPVVSGIGHETDQTIVDFVADVRASTPSNAAEIVFPDRRELLTRVQLAKNGLVRSLSEQIQRMLLSVHYERNRLQRLNPDGRIHHWLDRTHQSRQQLDRAITMNMQFRSEEIRSLRTRLNYNTEKRMSRQESLLENLKSRLQAVSPLRVLDRGYSLVYDAQKHLICTAKDASMIHEMQIHFRDGQVDVLRKDDSGYGTA